MANQLVPSIATAPIWIFEIAPNIEGESRSDPKNPDFVDSSVAYVHLYSSITLLTSLVLIAEPDPFPLPVPTALRKWCPLIREAIDR